MSGYEPLPKSADDHQDVLDTLVALPEAEVVGLLTRLDEKRSGILRFAASFTEVVRPPPLALPSKGFGASKAREKTPPRDELNLRRGSSREIRLSPRSAGVKRAIGLVASASACTTPSNSKDGDAGESVDGSTPLVQMSTFIYYCNEDDEEMTLEVVRAGDVSQASAVSVRTRDLSAKAGKTYHSVAKRLHFEPLQDVVTVSVPLISSDLWDTTTEFAVELHGGDEGLSNAHLGRYLWAARVKVIDNDNFPSNKLEEFVHDGERVEEAPSLPLFWEYVRLNWTDPVVRGRSIKCVVIDQLHNVYSFCHLFINVYLIDYVLHPHASDERLFLVHSKPLSLLGIVALVLLPLAVLHALDNRKANMYGVGGASRSRLQTCLLRKFLNYDAASRLRVSNADLIMAMTRDATLMVTEGYSSILEICKELGDLVFMFAYQFIAPVVFGKKFSVLAFLPLVFFPAAMLCFLEFRRNLTSDLLSKRNVSQNAIVGVVNETVLNYRLVADYSKRERCIKLFEAGVLAFNGANKHAGAVLKNNAYFARWLSTICIASWTLLGGTMVIEGDMTLGMFLANIHIFGKIGGAWGGIYKIFLDIMTMFPAQENVVRAMNLPTDVSLRKDLSKIRRLESATQRASLAKVDGGGMRIDRMEIAIGAIPFSYSTKSCGGARRTTTLNLAGIARIEQGQLVLFMGPSGGGKSTLLKILGGEILPRPSDLLGNAAGRFFVPSHLRVLHVSSPLFFSATLLSNLTFGVAEGDADGHLERVLSVCRKLGVEEDIVRLVESEETHMWSDVFSTTQCQLLSLARALVANPEVLCIHKPTQLFNQAATERITESLSEFVVSRGVFQAAPTHTRRPRTLIMSTARKSNVSFADRIFHVSKQWGIKEVAPPEYGAWEARWYDAVGHDVEGEG